MTKSDRVGWVPLRRRQIRRLLTTGKVLEQYIGLAAHLGGDGHFVALWQDDCNGRSRDRGEAGSSLLISGIATGVAGLVKLGQDTVTFPFEVFTL